MAGLPQRSGWVAAVSAAPGGRPGRSPWGRGGAEPPPPGLLAPLSGQMRGRGRGGGAPALPLAAQSPGLPPARPACRCGRVQVWACAGVGGAEAGLTPRSPAQAWSSRPTASRSSPRTRCWKAWRGPAGTPSRQPPSGPCSAWPPASARRSATSPRTR